MPIAKLNGTSLHYHVKGEGVPIVFIHPPLLTKANFNYQVAQLSGMFKVITLDLRGHGLSAPLGDAPFSYSLMTEDIKQLLDFLKVPKAMICGYSTGAQIALEMLLTLPDRCYGAVLLSGMSEASDLWLRGRIAMAVSLCRLGAKQTLGYAICRGNADSNVTMGNLYREAMKGDLGSWEQYYRYSLDYNCTSRLKYIDAPVLLVYGKKDSSFHRYAGLLQSELPNSKTVIVSKATHQLPTKWATATSNLIRMWAGEATAVERSAGKKEAETPNVPAPHIITPDAVSPEKFAD
jgi:pimeloyl-ACP methyl ester carboxylesterase